MVEVVVLVVVVALLGGADVVGERITFVHSANIPKADTSWHLEHFLLFAMLQRA